MSIKSEIQEKFPNDGRMFYHSDIVEVLLWMGELCAKEAERDGYVMYLTNNDIYIGALEDDYTPKVRKQARKEVADKIRTLVKELGGEGE